jgi:hypothetical protein
MAEERSRANMLPDGTVTHVADAKPATMASDAKPATTAKMTIVLIE